MRQWHPTGGEESLDGVYPDLPPADRPRWVAMNMITSVDGEVTIEGVSDGLGGTGDLAGFRALRSAVDVVLVGAGTARAERYGPAKVRAEARAARVERGQAPRPAIAVVSTSLDVDAIAGRVIEGGGTLFVVTSAASDPERRAALAAGGTTVLTAGDQEVDLVDALSQLDALGMSRVLVEGGPRLNRDLLAAGLVDELFVTIAPLLVGGGGPGVVAAPLDLPVALELREGRVHAGELLLRYGVLGPHGS